MLIQLLFAHTAFFALTVFSAFTFFAAGLLYFDSWQVDRLKKTPLLRGLGFFLLSIVAVVQATSVEVPIVTLTAQVSKIMGLIFILISLIDEPILHQPSKKKFALIIPFVLPVFSSSLIPLSAILTLLIAATYFRKATEGLDQQLKPAYKAFLFLGISEVLQIFFFWSDTPIVFWSKMLAPFGLIWSIQHIIEFIGIVMLAAWVWGYIRFRQQIQLFVMTVSLSLVLFLSTTVLFTFQLLDNLERDALSHLKTDIRVIQYAIERLQAEALASATAVAENSEVKNAFLSKNEDELYIFTSKLMLSFDTDFLAVTNSTGRVIMRGENKENVGDSLIFDPTVKSALLGRRLATVISLEGAIAPRIQVKASVPFYDKSILQGAISTGFWIDSAFVDGVKDVTGLDVTVFGSNKRAATTFLAPDGKSRFVGALEPNKKIISKVLEKGEIYLGSTKVLNQQYYTAYAPLKTVGDKSIGMLFVGKPQITLFELAKKSINLTFLGSTILIVLSLIPAYFFSRFLRENLEV